MNTLVAGQHNRGRWRHLAPPDCRTRCRASTTHRAMSQEGVAASQADLVVISADGLKGMGGEAGLWKLPGLAQTRRGVMANSC